MSRAWTEVISLFFVGALWGCTTPLIRKGALLQVQETNERDVSYGPLENNGIRDNFGVCVRQLKKFRYVQVWLPYAFNQAGSIAFYYLLSNSNLSIAVPSCNALALAFAVCTSWFLGEQEKVKHPIRSIVGSVLVVAGVMVCVRSNHW
jgi:Putative transmembrane family 234